MADEAEARRRRLEALTAMPDEEIDLTEMPEATDWSQSRRGLYRPRKERITIMVDADVLAHFRDAAGTRGYQTRINAALRQHVAASTPTASSGSSRKR